MKSALIVLKTDINGERYKANHQHHDYQETCAEELIDQFPTRYSPNNFIDAAFGLAQTSPHVISAELGVGKVERPDRPETRKVEANRHEQEEATAGDRLRDVFPDGRLQNGGPYEMESGSDFM